MHRENDPVKNLQDMVDNAPRPTPAKAMSPYIRVDKYGVMRIGDTRVSLDSILTGFHRGESPEAIQKSFPILTLEQVYGAIAYYLANRAEVDEYLRSQDKVWQYWKDKFDAEPSPLRERLDKARQQAAERAR